MNWSRYQISMLTLVVVWRQEDTEWEYPRELLELGQVLGEGTFGKVVTGHAHNTQLKDDIPGWVESRAPNEPSRSFHNHREGPH